MRRMESVTETMSRKGTFNYMAPEVNQQTSYDQRVDIYSLGLLLYQLRNGGMLPFIRTKEQLTNPAERVRALQRRLGGEKLPAPKDASKDLAAVILKATAYEPAERYTTAAETVTEGLTCSPTELGKAGTQKVKAVYGGKTAAFDVTVKDPEVTSLMVKSNPAKISYFTGDTLDRKGLALTAVYENGKTETVTEGFTCSPASFGTAGTQTVTVSYSGATTTFYVTVSNPPLRIVKSPQSVTLKSVDDTVTL